MPQARHRLGLATEALARERIAGHYRDTLQEVQEAIARHAVVVVGLVLSARFLAGFYTEYLWYDSVDRSDVFWGDRYARIKDPFGHEWGIATHLRDVDEAELARAAESCGMPDPDGSAPS